jgi:hypothetical protein
MQNAQTKGVFDSNLFQHTIGDIDVCSKFGLEKWEIGLYKAAASGDLPNIFPRNDFIQCGSYMWHFASSKSTRLGKKQIYNITYRLGRKYGKLLAVYNYLYFGGLRIKILLDSEPFSHYQSVVRNKLTDIFSIMDDYKKKCDRLGLDTSDFAKE